MSEEKSNKGKKDLLENVKEQATDFVNDTLTEENLEKVKQKAEQYSDIAKVKATEIAIEAKETLDDLKENASEIAGEAAEHLTNFAEEAKEDIKEVAEKSKTFFQKLFKK